MKWIRTAITVVIMVVSVGVIVLGINNLTQETVKEEVVTFEVLTYDSGTDNGTITLGTYNNIDKYVVIDGDIVTNFITITLNDGVLSPSSEMSVNNDIFYINDNDIGFAININNNDVVLIQDVPNSEIGATYKITFEVIQAPILTGTIAIILGLVPLIVASGVLYFMLRKNNLGD